MIQTGGFGFQPGSVSSGAESRIALSGAQGAPLRFVDGASLVPRSNAETWLAGRLAGINAIAEGVSGAGRSIGGGIAQSGANARENRRFLANVALKQEDQRLREQELAAKDPLDAARERLLQAQTENAELENQRLKNPWNPTRPPLADVTPEDLPTDEPDLSGDLTQSQITGTAPLSPAYPAVGAWVDQGNGMFTTTTVGPDGKPSRQFTAIADPSSPIGYKVIDEADLTKAADKAKGEPLLQDQMKVVSNIESARFTLGEITKKLDEIEARGPVTGTARAMNPYDVEAQSLENMVNSLVPGLARGVFGEVGVLTDKDVERYKRMIPNIKTDPSVAKKIVEELRRKLDSSLETNLNVWESSGYDVEGLKSRFTSPSSSTEPIAISSQAEYDKLKSGTPFTFQGRRGVKP